MLKAKIVLAPPMWMRSNFKKKKKKKNPRQPSIKKRHYFIFVCSLLVNDCILMYFETMILSIYNFLILYGCLSEVFSFFIF